jgi:translation initiation factor 2 subunit 2
MKKKKSKKQASDFAKELDELDADQNEEDAANTLPVDDGAVTGENGEKIDPWVAEDRRATYPEVSPAARELDSGQRNLERVSLTIS